MNLTNSKDKFNDKSYIDSVSNPFTRDTRGNAYIIKYQSRSMPKQKV